MSAPKSSGASGTRATRPASSDSGAGRKTGSPRRSGQSTDVPELLTAAEKEVVNLLGQASRKFRREVLGADPLSHDDDLREFVAKVHDLQHAVLSQAAARRYPTEYRLLGGS